MINVLCLCTAKRTCSEVRAGRLSRHVQSVQIQNAEHARDANCSDAVRDNINTLHSVSQGGRRRREQTLHVADNVSGMLK